MPYKVIDGYVTLDGARVAEVRGWDASSTGSKVDTTIIGTGRKRSKPGKAENTLNLQLYFDDTDPAQSQIRQGVQGLRVNIYYTQNSTLYRVSYGDCSVDSFNRTGQNLDGLVEATASLSVSGDVTELPA